MKIDFGIWFIENLLIASSALCCTPRVLDIGCLVEIEKVLL
jgi:hypothetical protein